MFEHSSRHLVSARVSRLFVYRKTFDICGSLGGVNLLFLKWNVRTDEHCPFYGTNSLDMFCVSVADFSPSA